MDSLDCLILWVLCGLLRSLWIIFITTFSRQYTITTPIMIIKSKATSTLIAKILLSLLIGPAGICLTIRRIYKYKTIWYTPESEASDDPTVDVTFE